MTATMRAARLHRARSDGAAEVVTIDEIPVPEPGPQQVRVRIRACGVCASDLHVVQGVTPHGPQLPQILGHEPAGEVDAVGDGVGDWQPGDRVAFVMARPCGRCAYCEVGRENICAEVSVPGVDADGAQAEYALADPRFLVPVPGALPFEQAAILTDAVATPYHALKRGGVGDGVTCAIFGLGGLGMHAIQLAKLAGASWVVGVDLDPVNLERALEWGANEVVAAGEGKSHQRVKALSGGGVDRSFEFVGHPETVSSAAKCLKPGGRATIVGLTPAAMNLMPEALFVAQELEVVGSFGSVPSDLNELMDLLEAGRLDLSRSITHRWSIEDFPRALEILEERDEHPIRQVVVFD
ncbi:MAG: alcohol dehydrogenase catalytic domain-containing protein [Nitriliruptorales bacterium]